MSYLSAIASCYAATMSGDSYISAKDVSLRLDSGFSSLFDECPEYKSHQETYETRNDSVTKKNKSGRLPLTKLSGKRFIALT